MRVRVKHKGTWRYGNIVSRDRTHGDRWWILIDGIEARSQRMIKRVSALIKSI